MTSIPIALSEAVVRHVASRGVALFEGKRATLAEHGLTPLTLESFSERTRVTKFASEHADENFELVPEIALEVEVTGPHGRSSVWIEYEGTTSSVLAEMINDHAGMRL